MTDKAKLTNIKRLYLEKAMPELMKRFGYKNVMEVPRRDKISINMGVGEAINDAKVLEAAAKDLGLITGQRPAIPRSRR